TLTRRKEDFTPLDPSNVRMYVCGPTVYDFAHIGNARPVIVFDVLFRLLRHLYGPEHVTYVRNITDVDDKINARALRDFPELPLNEAIRRVTEKTASQFQADVKALGCLEPSAQPRATEFIDQMIAMITVLLAKGNAYQAGGEVLFDVASMKDYGALSNRKLEDQQAGARVAVEAHKKNPGDFVLWKLSTAEEPGWESPWGRGRPGWHIECSAMSKSYLGEVFDIHGGGLDLIFPHHENELAQSRCAHGTKKMANIWMHNGFLQVEGQKMSKSLGNFVTINEVLETEKFGGSWWEGMSVRLAMLMGHYRQPIDWTVSRLKECTTIYTDWRLRLDQAVSHDPNILDNLNHDDIDEEFFDALCNDLNTSLAISRLSHLSSLVGENKNLRAIRSLVSSAKLLGIEIVSLGKDEEDYSTLLPMVNLINAREAARAAKDWKESDRIRDELAAMGVTIKDNKDGTTSWEVKR
ncbi:MAG: cysteine--tRNA ligase, partial [Hyphomicrobiales bacterium]|nr:cysteine--tRNA ligase [Hyphomicrobiales bacterium]